jgi:murein DD-endopeptidase MepM/ murein hydrolase activator NlpD
VRFSATSNFGAVRADLAALETQAAALNATLSKQSHAQAPAIIDANAWKRGSDAVTIASRAYREAASSSGILNTQQIRATSEAERYTQSLQKQKLSLMDIIKHQGIMKQVYQDQLKYQRMTAQYWGTDMSGRAVTDITIPKNVPDDLDTMRRRIGFFGNEVASASTQMVNLGKNIQWSGRQLMVGFTYPMVLFGAAAGVAAYKADAAFASINKVYDLSAKASTDSMQREKELADLRNKSMAMATDSAREYGTTLNNTLKVEQALAATGLKGQNLLSSTKQVNRISAIGDIDPTQTTQMVISLETAFKLHGDQVTNTLNFMNAAANATSLSLQDIAVATPRAANALAALGVNAKQMTVLLVSMRESGVEAAQGANALKSLSARILNDTIIKKASKMFTSFGEDINVGAIRDESKGNLMEFIKLLGQAENQSGKLTAQQKAMANATLAGTFQFSRFTSMLTNTADAYAGVKNQTYAALQLQKQSDTQLAITAKHSQELMMNNPAGKFRQDWALLQIQLVKMGQPFLEIADKALSAFTKVGSFFNNMPDWSKKAALIVLSIMALAGPVIMLSGLFVNLAGQFGKGVAAIAKFIGISDLVTKSEQAATLTAEAQNKAMMEQVAVVSDLAMEFKVLAESIQFAQKVSLGGLPMVSTQPLSQTIAGSVPVATGTKTPYGEPTITPPLEPIPPMTPPKTVAYQYTRGAYPAEDAAAARDAALLSGSTSSAARTAAMEERRITDQLAAQDRIRGQIGSKVTATNAGLAVGGAAMAGMLASSMGMLGPMNGIVGEASKFALITVTLGPALSFAYKTLKGMAVAAAAYAAEQRAAAAAAAASAVAGGIGTVSSAGGIGASLKVAAGSVGAMMGPIGWVATGVAAVGAGILLWKHSIDAAHAEELRFDASINSTAAQFATNLGLVKQGYIQIMQLRQKAEDQEKQKKYRDAYNPSGQFGQSATDFSKLSGDKQDQYATQHFLELMANYKMSAADAGDSLKALYSVAGKGADEANAKVKNLIDTFGSMSTQNILTNFAGNQAEIFKSKEFGSDVATKNGKDYADAWMKAFSGAKPDDAKNLLSGFTATLTDQFQKAFDNIMGSTSMTPGVLAKFKELGITSGETFRKYLMNNNMSGGDFRSMILNTVKDIPVGSMIGQDIANNTLTAQQQVQQLFNNLTNDNNSPFGSKWKDNSIHNIGQLKAALGQVFDQKFVSFDDGLAKVKQFKASLEALHSPLSAIPGFIKPTVMAFDGMNEAQAKILVNQWNANNGFKLGGSLAEALANYMNQVVDATAHGAAAANAMGVALSTAAAPILKTAYTNIENQIATDATDNFNNAWDKREAAMQAGQTAAENALKARHQAALDRIQKKITAEQNADTIRQRLYDNEKKRLTDLATLENQQIDFNTAVITGNLDQAAKDQNDMLATQGTNQMDAEQQAATDKTKAATDALTAQSNQLQKTQQKQETAMAAAHAASMKNLQDERAFQLKTLQQRLDLFKANTVSSKADLEAWAKEVGINLSQVAANVKGQGTTWAQYFRTNMDQQMKLAAADITSSNTWATIATNMVDSMMKAIGFKNVKEFNTFATTGVLPKGFGTDNPTHHGGGVIGGPSTGRGGIANTYAGLHPSEVMVRAQKGEYMIKKEAYAKHSALAEAINNDGVMGGQSPAESGTARPFSPLVGQTVGLTGNMFMHGIGQAIATLTHQNIGNALNNLLGAVGVNMPGGLSGASIKGVGGKHRPINGPVTSGIHDQSTGYPAVDLAGPIGRPIYAVGDGIVSRSYDIKGYEPRRAGYGKPQDGFASYGRVIYLHTNAGPEVLYAHLSQRSVAAGTKVPGGTVLGYSGDSGNSTGPHLHFGSKGVGPMAWLRKGGEIKWDNTAAILHQGETVLDKPLTKAFKERVASGAGHGYNVTVDLRGAYIKEDVDIEKAVNTAIDKREALTGRKRVIT